MVLKREPFDRFVDGSKRHEWRRYGKRFNEQTCAIGRRVRFAHGYARKCITGVITSVELRPATEGAAEIYGKDALCIVMGIALDRRAKS